MRPKIKFVIQKTRNKHPVVFSGISSRKRRKILFGRAVFYSAGDVLSILYWRRSMTFLFAGICMRKRKHSLLDSDAMIVLRNVLSRIGIECTFSYYLNRVYNLQVDDYKRKRFVYRRAKLYYIRHKVNQASRILKY